jgi:hypothetical protein
VPLSIRPLARSPCCRSQAGISPTSPTANFFALPDSTLCGATTHTGFSSAPRTPSNFRCKISPLTLTVIFFDAAPGPAIGPHQRVGPHHLDLRPAAERFCGWLWSVLGRQIGHERNCNLAGCRSSPWRSRPDPWSGAGRPHRRGLRRCLHGGGANQGGCGDRKPPTVDFGAREMLRDKDRQSAA